MAKGFLRNHQPLPTPGKWADDERRFALRLEDLITDLYQKIGYIRDHGPDMDSLKKVFVEKEDGKGLSENDYTDAEKEKLGAFRDAGEYVRTVNGNWPDEDGNVQVTAMFLADLDIQVTTTDWQSGQPWPDGNTPLGESASTCYLATITEDVNGNVCPCVDGAEFKPRDYSRARCPAPLWIYLGSGTVYVATTAPPTQNITIRGAVMLE